MRKTCVGVLCVAAASTCFAQSVRFESDVLPILKSRCWACHGGEKPQAGLDLRSLDFILKGGRSGPAIQPGTSDKSLLVEKIVSKAMPPVGDKLTERQIEIIRSWIDSAAGQSAVTENDVLPIFQMRCVGCHGKRKQEGGLDLRSLDARLKGGKSGPALVPGNPEASLLVQKITSGQMPPPKMLFEAFVRPPTSEEVETIRKWIAGGALAAPGAVAETEDKLVTDKDRDFWSFRPPVRPPAPKVRHADLVRNPIDEFLLEKLEAKGLSYSSPADRLTLLRRAYLDLIGLPPSPGEVRAFMNDQRPDAYEHLIGRLLDSPQYGERWAAFWLDAAGYSDSEGIIDEDLLRPNAWRYRDYVIGAFNADKPYDKFLTEQIAGDELSDYKNAKQVTPELLEKLVATGFLRMVPDGTYSPANGSIAERMNVIADEIEVLGSSVLGLTIGCARCHNHKYDPLPQRDYYRLSAVLQTAYDPYDWVVPTERKLDLALESERKQVAASNAPIEAEIKKLEAALEAKAKPFREKVLQERLATLPEDVRQDVTLAAATPEQKRTPTQTYLAEKFQDTLKVNDEELAKRFPEFKAELADLKKSIAQTKKNLRPKPEIRALYDMGGDASPAYLLRRGEAQLVGEAVQPGVPSVLRQGLVPYHVTPPRPDSSGRRLALARWLTQPNHPLTARVMMNRLWMHHFGRGIVAGPSNFGRLGSPPSHPELLDWLASEFVARKWSLKAMHRLMMTSTAYSQTSHIEPALQNTDPENVLLSRMTLRRMDAEQLHDSILKVTGLLDPTAFGPPVSVEAQGAGEIVATGSRKQGWRRSIYALHRRTTPVTMLEVFDLPPMSPNCITRSYSTVVTQALELTNSPTVRDRARYLAGRVLDEFPNDPDKQIEQIYRRALSRAPTADETQRALTNLTTMTKHWIPYLETEKYDAPRAPAAHWSALADFCHAMLISAEFTYID